MGHSISKRLEGFSWNESDRDKSGRDRAYQNRSVGKAGIRWWDIDPADLPDTGCEYQGSEEKSERSSDNIAGYGEIWPVKSRLGRTLDGLAEMLDFIKSH
jgi:hypothetical protein